MSVKLTVNKNNVVASKGETILNVLVRNGIKIPTLCYMEELSPTGACRLCVVEDVKNNQLITACSTPVEDGMQILTHSGKVIKARKTVVDLLLTNHPDNCLYCDKSGVCELQNLTEELNINERVYQGEKNHGKTDRSSPGIIRDMTRCILCGRCVRTCDEIIGVSAIDFINRGKKTSIDTVLNRGLFYSSCIHCGKCISKCPTGAILEKTNLQQVTDKLTGGKEIDVILSPSVIADIAVLYNIKKYEDSRDYIIAALKDIGFSNVYTMSFANDLFIYQAARFIISNLASKNKTNIVTCCPAVKKFIENEKPELLDNIININTPQQIFGKILKDKKEENGSFLASVVPCVSHKFEAVQAKNTNKGVPVIDFVLTGNEIVRLFKTHGIKFPYGRKAQSDKPSISDSSAGVLFEIKGGIVESILREIYLESGIEAKSSKIIELRLDKDFVDYEIGISKYKINLAVIEGLDTFRKNINVVQQNKYDIIELRSCNLGCIDGCGQRSTYSEDGDKAKLIKKIIYNYDDKNYVNAPSKNPFIKGFIKEYDDLKKITGI